MDHETARARLRAAAKRVLVAADYWESDPEDGAAEDDLVTAVRAWRKARAAFDKTKDDA